MKCDIRLVFVAAVGASCFASAFASVAVDVAHLPPGLSRFNPAGLSARWRYEGTAFEEFSAPDPVAATIPVFRLHNSKYGYLLTSSRTVLSAATKMGFVREGIAFYAPGRSGLWVLRFRDPKTGGYFFSISRKAAISAGFTYEGFAFRAVGTASEIGPGAHSITSVFRLTPVACYFAADSGLYLFTADHESPYQVGAYYFGSYAPSATGLIRGTQRVYGRRNDWWGGVRDFYDSGSIIPRNHRGWMGAWPDLKPEIGYYDQRSPQTLEQQINQAADAGLTFFSFYWYWSKKKHGELEPEALSGYLAATNVDRLKFNLTLYAHPWSDDLAIDGSDIGDVIRRLVHYFRSPHYLRLPDGRPVFSIGDDRNIRGPGGVKCADTACYQRALAEFLTRLRRRSIREIGVVPYVEIQAGVPGWDRQPGVDAITCLVPPITIAGATPYPHFTRSTFAPLVHTKKPVSPCMMENFDERPRQDVLIPNRSAVRYLKGMTDILFRENLEVAKSVSDRSYALTHSPASRLVYLYAWNEWHEGGILEPSVATGARHLNIVTDVFGLPRLPSACLDQGECKLHQWRPRR